MVTENMGVDNALFNYVTDTFANSPFYNLIGISLKALGQGNAEILVTTARQHTNPVDLVHGGLIMTIADAAMGNSVRSLGFRPVTVDCATSFLASAEFGKDIVAKGQVVKNGKNILFVQANVWSDSKLIATAKATFFKIGIIEL